jgi:hypothetical protein
VTDSKRPPAAVFGQDNTLADTAHRQRFLERRPHDWDAFFAAAPHDPPLEEGIALARESAEECAIVCLTGRPEHCRRDTLDWLAAHGLPEGPVHMRGDTDRRPARWTEPEILREGVCSPVVAAAVKTPRTGWSWGRGVRGVGRWR